MFRRVIADAPGREHQAKSRSVETRLYHDTRYVFQKEMQGFAGVHTGIGLVTPSRGEEHDRMVTATVIMLGKETFNSLINSVPYLVTQHFSVTDF